MGAAQCTSWRRSARQRTLHHLCNYLNARCTTPGTKRSRPSSQNLCQVCPRAYPTLTSHLIILRPPWTSVKGLKGNWHCCSNMTVITVHSSDKAACTTHAWRSQLVLGEAVCRCSVLAARPLQGYLSSCIHDRLMMMARLCRHHACTTFMLKSTSAVLLTGSHQATRHCRQP